MTKAIDPSLFLSNIQYQNEKQTNNTMGKDTFLKLLVAQLQNQDPLNPIEDKEFIAQLANFTSLEQLMSMNETMNSMMSMQKENQLLNYQRLMGKDITWHKILYDDNGEPFVREGTGKIIAMEFKENGPAFYLSDGTELTAANISKINDPIAQPSLVQASFLIGKQVTWKDNDAIREGIVHSVSQKNGKIIFHIGTDDQIKVTTEQILSIKMTHLEEV